jgi:hypothetical protein
MRHRGTVRTPVLRDNLGLAARLESAAQTDVDRFNQKCSILPGVKPQAADAIVMVFF